VLYIYTRVYCKLAGSTHRSFPVQTGLLHTVNRVSYVKHRRYQYICNGMHYIMYNDTTYQMCIHVSNNRQLLNGYEDHSKCIVPRNNNYFPMRSTLRSELLISMQMKWWSSRLVLYPNNLPACSGMLTDISGSKGQVTRRSSGQVGDVPHLTRRRDCSLAVYLTGTLSRADNIQERHIIVRGSGK
jgi:hypothetical protein